MRRYIHIFKISIALVAVTLTVSCNKNSGATESGNELEIIDTKPASEVNATDYSFCILSPSLNGEFAAEVATRFKGGPADFRYSVYRAGGHQFRQNLGGIRKWKDNCRSLTAD